jgi:hypothetical protein
LERRVVQAGTACRAPAQTGSYVAIDLFYLMYEAANAEQQSEKIMNTAMLFTAPEGLP